MRGLDLVDLADWSFEELAEFLWRGIVPGAGDGTAFAHDLGQARCRVFAALAPVLPVLAKLPPIDAVHGGVALLADGNDPKHDALNAVAAITRLRQGRDPLPPDAEAVRGLTRYLVTVADHGMNASTFATRVAASTRAGVIASVIAGICALKGPLHGGVPGPVLDMLDAIAQAESADTWLTGELGHGRRLIGFGHRIYRTRDPRADVLKRTVAEMSNKGARLKLAERVERTAVALLRARQPGRRLETNVEFYTAILLDAVGLPRDLFTPVFAMGRVLGWVAHASEQVASNRLIRPAARYVGPLPADAPALAVAG